MVRLRSGVLERVSPRVRRIIAPNPGRMTGPGTNTYLIGEERLVVVDPGPAIDSHVEAILAAADDGASIGWILVSHTHLDHSPAAAPLARACKVPVLGCPPPDSLFQDPDFHADQEIHHQQQLDFGPFHLRCIHTPGHVGNHFCFLLEEEGLLFSGDHLIDGSTVVIVPPGGSMADYLASLKRLLDYPLQRIAPGHGNLIDHPREVVEWTIRHRLERERKTLTALGRLARPVTVEQLVVSVYDDVDAVLHSVAQMSLLAHLIKLEQEGRAVRREQLWSLSDPQV